MPNAWTEDDTEKLVALYGQYQCLWNPFHPEFSDKSSRYKAYKEIKSSIDIPGLTICDCIERITSVKEEYCYELSKIAAAIFCEKLYTPKAKWFKGMHMLFFPYKSSAHKKLDSKEPKFNDSGTQDNFFHSSFEKLEVKHICSNDTCGTCKPPEIKLRLTLRDSVHSAPKLQGVYTPSETIQKVDVAAGTSRDIAERETQTDIFDEQKYVAYVKEEKKEDYSTHVDDTSVGAYSKRKTENNFDIFGKSVAFQMRTIDIKSAMELKKEIQSLITKARLKTLESKLMNQNINSICCCDCSDCKIMCKDETCSCGLTLKECLLLTKINKEKSYGFSYK